MSANPGDPENALRVMHGMRVLIPADWEDSSLYRFNAPRDEKIDAPAGDQGPLLQANVLISRHPAKVGDSVQRFLELANAETKERHSGYKVIRSGSTIYLEQVSAWQEVRFTDALTSQTIFQCQVATQTWPQHFTLATITGTQAAVARIVEKMGLVLGEPPGGARIGTGTGGVVAANLVSK